MHHHSHILSKSAKLWALLIHYDGVYNLCRSKWELTIFGRGSQKLRLFICVVIIFWESIMDTIHSKTTKESLIADIKRRLDDRIIEESNAKLLIKLIKNADDLNEAINIAAIGTTCKKTGFHFDKRLEKLGNDIKYFKKNTKLSFAGANNGDGKHKLIIGDNYDALQNLLIEYKGKVDVIYIDPPYGKDSMGEFAETNYDNAITRDNLFSMLYNRLVLAKELMSDEGVIFCSIDDRNQAYLKCLFDEIFGEKNFICNFVVNSAPAGQQSSTYVAIQQSYCLMYKKHDIYELKNLQLNDDEIEKKYDVIENGKRYYTERIWKRGVGGRKEDVPSLHFPVYYDSKNDIIYVDDEIEQLNETDKKSLIKIIPYQTKGVLGRWTWSRETMRKNKESMIVKLTSGEYKLYKKVWETEEKGVMMKSIIDSNIGRTEIGSLELKSIFDEKVFLYPKSSIFIKTLLRLFPDNGCVVIDFFAGSGTTGQAVLELNKEDGGNRQFILCTNNEKTDTTPNGIALDVTAKRLKRVMTGECYDGTNDFEWIKKNEALGGSLDVYDIASVFNYENTKGKTAFDVIDETLYGMPKFKNVNDKIKWVCENFEHTQKFESEE